MAFCRTCLSKSCTNGQFPFLGAVTAPTAAAHPRALRDAMGRLEFGRVSDAQLRATPGRTAHGTRRLLISLGLLAHLLRFGGWGGCQGALTTEPEEMVGALGLICPLEPL